MTQYAASLKNTTPTHTDITRLRKGHVGGQVRNRGVERQFLKSMSFISSFGRSTRDVNTKAKMPLLVSSNKSI